MLRAYKWRGAMWRFEDGKAPEGAVLVEAVQPVTPETPKKAPARRATRRTRQKADTNE